VYGVTIIVSEQTRLQANEFFYRELDRVCVKGKQKPVTIFQPMGLLNEMTSEFDQELKLLDQALKLFRAQQWQQARASFQEMATLAGGGVACHLNRLYSERIEQLEANPPGTSWNGVYAFKTK